MKRWKRRTVAAVRKVLTCAIGVIALFALVSVHIGVELPSTEVTKLPTKQYEVEHQNLQTEESWDKELAPPHLPKMSQSARKLDGTSWTSNSSKLWKPPPNRDYAPCVAPSPFYTPPPESRGYLLVHTNGGLNQMRAGICDMVAVARIINATLVIPELDKHSFWQDSSKFSDVFDEDHFIDSLKNDIKIIKKLPKELAHANRIVKQFRSWSSFEYYKEEIAALWDQYLVIRVPKSDSRLANNNLPPDIQKLRCRTCYKGLRFAPKIEAMAKLLVHRMKAFGPYIALHLRYEKDVLAFSGCTHDLSHEEAEELKSIRENTSWWKVKEIDPVEKRAKGFCPLTPKEVGMFLTALGFPSNTPIYVAAGEIYGGDLRMADLHSHFPLLMNKQKLASNEELEPFANHASQLAALDHYVSIESDVFIPSFSGNMAWVVEGHRRFLGHKKTVSPDRKALVRLFDKFELGTIKELETLEKRIAEIHKNRLGSPRKRKGPISGTKGMDRFRSEEPFYVNPLPDCLCQKESSILNRPPIMR